MAFNVNILIGVFVICLLVAFILGHVGDRSNLSGDVTLGILSHSTLALGLVLVSLMYWIRVDILNLLFGNILSVTWNEIAVIYIGGAFIIAVIVWKWNALISLTVDEQIAAVEGMNPVQTRYILMILLATIVAFALKIVGVILTVALLIIPAAAARQFSKTPEQMAVVATLFGASAVVSGPCFFA